VAVFGQSDRDSGQGGSPIVIRIQKWGNSQGVRLSKRVLDEAGLALGDVVEVIARGGKITIAKVRLVSGKADLQELVDAIPDGYQPGEFDWGEPQGMEKW